MNEEAPRCVMILSDKSSGSSILQEVLAAHPRINILEPGHFHCESRYWMYAAAILDPAGQPRMRYSHEFPIRRREAVDRLNRIMQKADNGRTFHPESKPNEFHAGWAELCRAHAPVFLEKSPHHLHSRPALELIMEFRKRYPRIRTRFIGLIRNPMDTLYSMYRRWHAIPEKRQFEWLRAYRNLKWMAARLKEDLLPVRYEDLVRDVGVLQKIYAHCGLAYAGGFERFSPQGIRRWKTDRWWGFDPAPAVKELAAPYYPSPGLTPASPFRRWFLMRAVKTPGYRLQRIKRLGKEYLKRWIGKREH